MRLKLINNISEIEPLEILDSIDVGFPARTKKLYCTRPLNVIQLKLRWVTSNPDITSLTIIEGRYLYCPMNERKWLRLWAPIVLLDAQCDYVDIDLSEYCRSRAGTLFDYNIIILPDYYGDYGYHFGHFLIDVLPILVFLGMYQASLKLGDIKYALYPFLGFHEEIVAHEGLHHLISAQNNMKVLDAFVYADSRRVIWAERCNARIVLPDRNYGFAKAMLCKSGSMEKTSIDSSRRPSIGKLKRVFRGLIFDRSGSSVYVRATNCFELQSEKFFVNTKSGRIELSFESFDYIKAGVYGRVETAEAYDFVAGPFGSHFIPTMLSLNVLHMFIVPFIPPSSLIEERLEGFCYYPRNLYRWIPASPSWQPDVELDMQNFHYSEYVIDINFVVSRIASALSELYGNEATLA